MERNSGINFAGWVAGLLILAGVVMPVALTLLHCVGSALAGVIEGGR